MTIDTKPAGRRGATIVSNEAVYQCYVDLAGANPPIKVTRQEVADALGVPFRVVDDHTNRLMEKGLLRRLLPGVFEPTQVRADRAVSSTALPSGGVKLEIGDDCLDLTSREARMVLLVLGGFGMNFDRIQAGRVWARQAATMKRQIQDLNEQVERLRFGNQVPMDFSESKGHL